MRATAGMSAGLGPQSGRGAILLEATHRGVPLHRTLVVRCPIDTYMLRQRLSKVFGLVSSTIKVVYQSAPDCWDELGDSTADLLAALERQPQLKALPVHVTGESALHLPVLHWIASLIALANLLVSFLFVYVEMYTASPAPPAPWIFLMGLPPLIIAYNAYAATSAVYGGYL